MAPTTRLRFQWTPWAYALVCAPLVLLMVELLRGALHETQAIGGQTLQLELQEMRLEAMRQARGLEVLLESHQTDEEPWEELSQEPWLSDYWAGIKLGPHQLYAAVVDEAGKIVMHTNPSTIGQRLEREWYDRRVTEAGHDFVRTQSSTVSNQQPAYGVTVPVRVVGRPVGEYHQGLDATWGDACVAAVRRAVMTRWCWVLAVIGAVDAAAAGALLFLGRRQARLGRLLRGETRERSREISQLGAGLAHEIRNPLHALRINLHTLRRSLGGRSPLPQEQIVATIEESNAAIERLDGLMRDLLQFCDRSSGHVADVDVVHEVRAAMTLLAEGLRKGQIEVHAELPSEPAPVSVDLLRFRQTLLNLLIFAQNRAGKSGTIEIQVTREGGGVEIAIGDSGPPLLPEQRARLFEPFQAPAETGSGLGLALVQLYVKEAGGRASCEGNSPASRRCRVWLPLATSASKGGLS
jgi:signal transduction histidine kinase